MSGDLGEVEHLVRSLTTSERHELRRAVERLLRAHAGDTYDDVRNSAPA